ncbi:MAG TPA: alpha/beta fold hydrolase [Chitinophagaceae bacterium]|nr:alpha/beta fold hydrolase [Chitinophagaceae bacterium]
MKRKIIRWAKLIVLLYAIIGIALYYLQDKLFFRPVAVDRHHNYNFTSPYKDVNIPYDETSNLNIIQFTTDTQNLKGVVLYFHGNRRNVSHYAPYADIFVRAGYEVWMMDYPGFGKSTGEFNEQRLYDWALTTYKLARKRFSPDSIIIYGKSLGTGIATQLAAVRDCKHLLLETPYYSFPSVLGQWAPIYPVNSMVRYKIPTYQYIQKVTAPITIFQGTDDGVIWHSNAARLKRFLKPQDKFVSIEDGSHNDLTYTQPYQQHVAASLQ